MGRMMRFSRVAALCLLATAAQAEERPGYHNLRFEEDWSAFSADAPGIDRVKHIDLTDKVWLSIGGDSRLRLEGWSGFGFSDENDAAYASYRSFLHTDWHFGEHVRLFVQGRYSNVSDRELPGNKRDALDVDRMDLWNTFLQFDVAAPRAKVMLRVGRQELQYGAQRLISPLDWSNTRRIFDGGLLRISDPDKRWQVDAFVTAPVIIDGDAFTWNDTNHNRLFSGIYYTQKLGDDGHAMDAYFLALNDDDDLAISDDRYTLGGRVYGPITDQLSYEIEGAFQFGDRDIDGRYFDTHQDIRAWMLTGELTYTFTQANTKPFIKAGVDYASGDSDPDDDQSETFSHLYPLGHAYLGFIDAVGRQNVIDARLSAGLWAVPKKLKIWADAHFFWRASDDDGLYNAGGGLSRGTLFLTEGGRTIHIDDRDVGQEIDLTMLYKINPRWELLAGYGHFFAGDFIDNTGAGEDIDFVYSQLEFTF